MRLERGLRGIRVSPSLCISVVSGKTKQILIVIFPVLSRSHLTNSDTHHSSSSDSPAANAEALKEQGNAKFEARAFKDAIKLYSKAIAINPDNATYYSNRAAAWMMLGALDEAITDSNKAILIDPTHLRSYLRLSKAFCDKGDFAAAEQRLSAIAVQHPDHEISQELVKVTQLRIARESAETAYSEGRFEEAHNLFQVSTNFAFTKIANFFS
jgi:tetratricopeptide (TPR) repeat protein